MKKEYGRSMIEMLGVLAIIGVLSIGGLAGYTMAMNRHRANTALEYVSRCAVLAQTYGTGTGTLPATADTCGELDDSEAILDLNTSTVARADNGNVTVTLPTNWNTANSSVYDAFKQRFGTNPSINGLVLTFGKTSS